MINKIPNTFPTHQYHWVLAERTKTKDGFLRVTFETNEQYKETLRNPYQLAQSAVDDDCLEIWLYVKGAAKPKIKMVTESVLGLGRRIGAI